MSNLFTASPPCQQYGRGGHVSSLQTSKVEGEMYLQHQNVSSIRSVSPVAIVLLRWLKLVVSHEKV